MEKVFCFKLAIRYHVVLCLTSILLLACCTDSDVQTKRLTSKLTVQEYDINGDGVLHGEPLPIQVMGATDIVAVDSMLIVTTGNRNALFSVINTGNLSDRVDFGKTGRARNDFLDIPSLFCKHYLEEKDGDLIMYVSVLNETKSVNLTRSIAKGSMVPGPMEDTEIPLGKTIVHMYGETYFSYTNKIMESPEVTDSVPYFSIIRSGNESRIPVYGQPIEADAQIYFLYAYYGLLCRKPDGTKMAFAMTTKDYLHIMDMKKGTAVSIHRLGGADIDDKADRNFKVQNQNADVSDNYIILLSPHNTDDGQSSIRIFDWNGRLIGCHTLDRQVERITFDSENQVLYGLDSIHEMFYKFDLSGICISTKL